MPRGFRTTRPGRPLALTLDIVRQRTGTDAREACDLLLSGHRIASSVLVFADIVKWTGCPVNRLRFQPRICLQAELKCGGLASALCFHDALSLCVQTRSQVRYFFLLLSFLPAHMSPWGRCLNLWAPAIVQEKEGLKKSLS